jgi:hypothetical protein
MLATSIILDDVGVCKRAKKKKKKSVKTYPQGNEQSLQVPVDSGKSGNGIT